MSGVVRQVAAVAASVCLATCWWHHARWCSLTVHCSPLATPGPLPLLCVYVCVRHQVEAHAGLISRAEQEAARLAEERQALSARTAQLTAQVRQSADRHQQQPYTYSISAVQAAAVVLPQGLAPPVSTCPRWFHVNSTWAC